MTILHVFLGLLWAFCALGSLIAGMYMSYQYALEADSNDVAVLPAIGGVALRILITLAIVALIVGVPLQIGI